MGYSLGFGIMNQYVNTRIMDYSQTNSFKKPINENKVKRMGDNFTIPCPIVQSLATLNQQPAIGCGSCSVNKNGSKQALYQIRRPDNCNLYHFETPYPPLPLVLAPMQSSNVSWSSYTVAKNPLFTYSTPKLQSGGPFERFNMNLFYRQS